MKQKVSLVLSGGGARGIAHIGVIEELEKQGYQIASIAGTSMGALVGAVYALGKLEEFKKWMLTLDKKTIFQLIDLSFSKQGLIKGDRVFNKMKEFIEDENIEDLPIPFVATATDIINKKQVVFNSGSVFGALRASIAIPTVITPIEKDGVLLVDGGVINNLPLECVKRVPNDILIAVNVNANTAQGKPLLSEKETQNPQSKYQEMLSSFHLHFNNSKVSEDKLALGYFELINKTVNLLIDRNTQLALAMHKPDILIEISSETCGMFDFFCAQELVETGCHTTVTALQKYKSTSKWWFHIFR